MNDGAHLLIVEQDTGTLTVISRALHRAGYRITEAQNGLAALRHPQEPPVDLILLSTRLPVVDGYQSVQQLKESLPFWETPVLLLVPQEEVSKLEDQRLHGANGYIQIPCPTSRLIEKVESLLVEKKIAQEQQARLRIRLKEYLDSVIEQTVNEVIQTRTQTLVQELSAGMVDLIEQEARDEMQRRITSLAEEQGREAIGEIVRQISAPLVNEVAEDAVTRQISSIMDEKADALVGRFEQEDMPEIARRVTEQTATSLMPQFSDDLIQNAKQKLIREIADSLPKLVENQMAQSLPKVVQQKLTPLIESQVELYLASALPGRIKTELQNEITNSVTPRLKGYLGKVLWLSIGLLILAAVAGVLLGKFLPV